MPELTALLHEIKALQEQNNQLQKDTEVLRQEQAGKEVALSALKRSEARYRDIFDNSTKGIFQWSGDRRLLSANRAFARIMGYPTVDDLFETLAGKPFQFSATEPAYEDLIKTLDQHGFVETFELEVQRRDGMTLWGNLSARRIVPADGAKGSYVAFIENITPKKDAEEKLLHQAFHDSLTGLPNRALFRDRLRMSMRRSARRENSGFSALYLDLNHFKYINDSLGHMVGDAVLCHAAQVLRSCVREVDTVARFGGDEFGVLIERTESLEHVVQVVKRIYSSLTAPFVVNGQELTVGSSIGVVLHGEEYDNPKQLLRDADTAMYRAKADPERFYRIFDQAMREETVKGKKLEKELLQAEKSKSFFIELQPVVRVSDSSVVAFEALLRWSKGEEIFRLEDIQDTTLIHSVALRLVKLMCRQAKLWADAGKQNFLIYSALAVKFVTSPGFFTDVERILRKTQAPAHHLLFEVDEKLLARNFDSSAKPILQVKQLGVHFCLSNFGTDLSALLLDNNFDFEYVSISGKGQLSKKNYEKQLIIMRHLAALGRELGLKVKVRDVESLAQADALKESGCEYMQGDCLYPPLSANEAAGLIS